MGKICPDQKKAITQKCTAVQLHSSHQRSYFLVCYVFPLDLIALKCVFWIWRKSNLIVLGRGRSAPAKKYMSCQIIIFLLSIFFIIFFVSKERPNYTTNAVVVWPRKVIIAVCKNC